MTTTIMILFYYLPAIIGIIASAIVGAKMIRRAGSGVDTFFNIVFMMTISVIPIMNIIWLGCITIAKMIDLKG